MNETMQTIHSRRSTRAFKSDPVPEDLINQVIDAGLWAASGRGKQSPIIIAVTNPEMRNRIAEANRIIGG